MDAAGNILERNAYYPFGLQTDQGNDFPNMSSTLTALYPRYINPSATRRDLYNGKEIQTIAGTDYLDYGFRQYDPVTARWMAVDPKAEKYLPMTPYNYCAGNPISLLDYLGMQSDTLSWWARNKMNVRIEGLAKTINGIEEGVCGAAVIISTGETYVGALLGLATLLHGGDLIGAGFNQMIYGEETATYSNQLFQYVGFSKENANTIDNGLSILLSAGSGAYIKASQKAVLKNTENANILSKQSSFFDNTSYTNKVKRQMQLSDFHSFPESVTTFEKYGTVSEIKGGDGIIRTKLSIPGWYKGQEGAFEFIKDQNNMINHRFFNPLKK